MINWSVNQDPILPVALQVSTDLNYFQSFILSRVFWHAWNYPRIFFLVASVFKNTETHSFDPKTPGWPNSCQEPVCGEWQHLGELVLDRIGRCFRWCENGESPYPIVPCALHEQLPPCLACSVAMNRPCYFYFRYRLLFEWISNFP